MAAHRDVDQQPSVQPEDPAEVEVEQTRAPDAAVASSDEEPVAKEEALAFDAAVEGPEADDHERKVQLDLEELTAKAQKADEYLELAQRTKADFENFRKRAAREAAAAQERGVAKLARELLPAVDNLDRALAAAEATVTGDGAGDDGTAPLISGIKLVHSEVMAALARAGIEPFCSEGEPFDPQRHEAVAQQPVEGAESGTIAEVYQRGYRMGDSVLRPARVVVVG